jgi:outer membrane protein insertion porin family
LREDAESAACDASARSLDAVDADDSLASAFEPTAGTVASVRVEANAEDVAARAKPLLQLRPGAQLDDAAVQADVRRLWALGGLEDVQVHATGPEGARAVTFVVQAAPKIRSLFRRGDGDAADEFARELGFAAGATYTPSALSVGLARAQESLMALGYREAKLTVTGRRLHDGRVDVCMHLHQGRKLLLAAVKLVGNDAVPTAELTALFAAEPGKPLRDAELERGVLQMQALYYDRGMITARVAAPEIRVVDGALHVRIAITEGPVYTVGSVQVTGELATTKRAYLARMKTKSGQVFSRTKLAEDLARLQDLHREQKAPEVTIEPQNILDAKQHKVNVVLRVGARSE